MRTLTMLFLGISGFFIPALAGADPATAPYNPYATEPNVITTKRQAGKCPKGYVRGAFPTKAGVSPTSACIRAKCGSGQSWTFVERVDEQGNRFVDCRYLRDQASDSMQDVGSPVDSTQ